MIHYLIRAGAVNPSTPRPKGGDLLRVDPEPRSFTPSPRPNGSRILLQRKNRSRELKALSTPSRLVKLPAHSAALPGNDLLFNIVPLDPAHRAELAGHTPVKKFHGNIP